MAHHAAHDKCDSEDHVQKSRKFFKKLLEDEAEIRYFLDLMRDRGIDNG